MAIKRTGSRTASWWNRIAKIDKRLLTFLGLSLELIGRPVLWLILGFIYLSLQIFHLIKQFSQIAWPLLVNLALAFVRLSALLVFSIIKLISLVVFYLISHLIAIIPWKKLKINLRFLSISLPKIQRPKISFPKFSLPKLRWPKIKISIRYWLIFFSLYLLTTVGYLGYLLVLKDLPQPDRLITRPQIISTKIYDRQGHLLYKIYRNQNRTLVRLADIPASLIQATIAIEDSEFYQHYGFSARGILRSIIKNLSQGELQGGSTITQQLVKNTLLTPERTITRKLKELILSIQTEMRFSKEEILQMYLNEVGYGGAAYGAEEAAWKYFGKSVRQLSLPEAALLAGLPASPTSYSPFGVHPEMAKQRQILVLQRMAQEGFITLDEAEAAKSVELKFAPQETDIKAPHFVMYIKDLLVKEFGEQLVEEGGLEVTTTLDLEIQDLAQKILKEEIDRLRKLNVQNGAVLITNPRTGEILAMVGSYDYFDSRHDGNVNVTLRPRQPGSSIKPVNYAVALGSGFTPATILSDTPITYQIPNQPPYSPRNYDNRFHGNIPLRVALASSYNVPAVKVLSSYGVNRMIEMGKTLGITTWEDEQRFGLALTLGGGEVKMVDMAVAYGTMANLGQRVNLNPIININDYQGKIYPNFLCPSISGTPNEAETKTACQPQPVLDPKIAYLIDDILSDNQARTPGFGPYSTLYIPGKTVAVKTGTTNNLRDNWTFGYTPNLLTSVWVGNNDNSPMSQIASGLTGASSIWNKIMLVLLNRQENQPFIKPEGIIKVKICSLTGTLPCADCPTREEIFIAGTEPKVACLIKKEVEPEGKILGVQVLTPTETPVPEPVTINHKPKHGKIMWERIRR